MQRLKRMIQDDDSAVSPVIGVILMVAITVILAAVIASFVLGLGDETDDVSPNIKFDASWDQEANTTTLTIDTADANADATDVYIRGGAVEESDYTWDDAGAEISAGESVTLEFDSDVGGFVEDGTAGTNDDWTAVEGDEIVIVFETDDTSDTLETIEVVDDS